MKDKGQKIWQIISLILLVVVFIGCVIACFFCYRYWQTPRLTLDKRVKVESQTSGESDMVLPTVATLSFREDALRFLSVYFEQEFDSTADKKIFVEMELNRFSGYPVKTEEEKAWNIRLVAQLKKILARLEAGQMSLASDDQPLLNLMKELK